MTRSLAGIVLALAVGGVSAAQETSLPPAARVEVLLEPTEVTVGDPVRATLSVDLPAAAAPPRFPTWGNSWGDAEIASVSEPIRRVLPQGTRWQQQIDLRLFQPGETTLPAPDIRLPGGAAPLPIATDRLRLHVRSVLPEGVEDPEPLPPVAAVPLPVGRRFWATAATAAAVLALLLAVLIRRGRGVQSERPTPSVPPIERFRSDLEVVLANRGEPAWTALSVSVRRYLGARLAFPALESTTTEVRRRLSAANDPAIAGESRRVSGLLSSADGVRFARREVTEQDLQSAVELARTTIESIETALRTVEEAVAETERAA